MTDILLTPQERIARAAEATANALKAAANNTSLDVDSRAVAALSALGWEEFVRNLRKQEPMLKVN